MMGRGKARKERTRFSSTHPTLLAPTVPRAEHQSVNTSRNQGAPDRYARGTLMDDTPILVEQRHGYRVIMLNRPQRLNAFTERMHVMLRDALVEAEADENCRALLLTGAGRGFCAGQDLNDRLSQAGQTSVLGGTLEAYYN